MLPTQTPYNPYSRSFQYEILNNILLLNKKLSSLYSFGNLEDETSLHLISNCYNVKSLWMILGFPL